METKYQMAKDSKIILCEGTDCPIANSCAFYNEGMDLTKTLHWGKIPYDHQKKSCKYYEEIDIDIPFNN